MVGLRISRNFLMRKFKPYASGEVDKTLKNQLITLLEMDSIPLDEKVDEILDCMGHVRNSKQGFRTGVEFMNEFFSCIEATKNVVEIQDKTRK